MILAAGEGTRLGPLTMETPKVLLPIGGVPLIQHSLAWLRSYGIFEIAVNLYYLGDKIRSFLGDGSRFGVKITYSQEETLLGTAGGVRRMEQFFNDTFMVVYGDNLTDFDLSAMLEFHQEKMALATLAIFRAPNPSEVGIVRINGQRRITSLVEKASLGSALENLANGGIYVLEREVLSHIPSQGFSDFSYSIFPKLIKLGLPVYGYALRPEDYFLDIGTPDNYHQSNEDMRAGKVKIKY